MGNERLDDLAFLKDLGSFATHRLTLIMYDPMGNERLDDLEFLKDFGSFATHRLIIIYTDYIHDSLVGGTFSVHIFVVVQIFVGDRFGDRIIHLFPRHFLAEEETLIYRNLTYPPSATRWFLF